MSNVTRILNAIERGDAKATDELLPLVYEELRLLAAQKFLREASGLAPSQPWTARTWALAASHAAMRKLLTILNVMLKKNETSKPRTT